MKNFEHLKQEIDLDGIDLSQLSYERRLEISQIDQLNSQTILNNFQYLIWSELFQHTKFSRKLIYKLAKVCPAVIYNNFSSFVKTQKIITHILDYYKYASSFYSEKANNRIWGSIIKYQQLSEKQLVKYYFSITRSQKIYNMILKYQKLSPEFIKKYSSYFGKTH